MEQKQFKISQQFRDQITAHLGRLAFEQVAQIMPLINKEILTENEINTLLGEMGRMSWIDVKDFFSNLQSMISEVFPPAEKVEPAETTETAPKEGIEKKSDLKVSKSPRKKETEKK